MYDIIIVGAGPAGAIAAKYLAGSGKKVLLLQKDLSFKKPCGGGIRMDAFDEFKIDKCLVKNFVDTIVLETKKKSIEFDISSAPLGVVDRVEFDEALRNDAMNAGAKMVEAKVVDVEVLSSTVAVEAQLDNARKRYQGRYLIAADGVLSAVRKKVRAEEVPKRLAHYSDVNSLPTSKCYFYLGSTLTDRAYAWRFPYKGGADVGTFSKKSTKEYIYNLFKFLGIKEDEKVRGYNIPIWEKPLFYDDRVFYVGDSAGQVSPFTYEGIYYAMKSAKILSEVIIEDVDFTEYEERWNKLYFKKFNVLKRLQRIFLSHDLMIFIIMKTLEKPKMKQKLLDIWMDKYEIKIDVYFFARMFRRVFQ
jgi:geranylgeranyl reductase